MRRHRTQRGPSKILYALFFGIFLLFLYGPMATVILLSFQGPLGTMSFPLKGFGLTWWRQFLNNPAWGEAIARSLTLAVIVAALTTVLALLLGLAYRRPFRGSGLMFYVILASAITPGILISVGTFFLWSYLGLKVHWYNSALGAQVTWTLPFGFLIIIAVFNRFNPSFEEAARDLGASGWKAFLETILPLTLPGLVGSFLFGFTLSFDEFARTMFVTQEKTLPLQIIDFYSSRTPAFYALGAATTFFSLLVLGIASVAIYSFHRITRR
jgi:putative spermidine/putrescine transport system permease protein